MESLIDRKYRLVLFDSCLKKPVFTGTPSNPGWKLECPLCGAAGASLVWLPSRSTTKFFCSTKSSRNCRVQVEFPVLLKMWNLSLYYQYLQEREEEGTAGAGFNVPLASQVLPQRRSKRRLNRSKCQVPPEPKTGDPGHSGKHSGSMWHFENWFLTWDFQVKSGPLLLPRRCSSK